MLACARRAWPHARCVEKAVGALSARGSFDEGDFDGGQQIQWRGSSNRGVGCSNRSMETPNLGFEKYGGMGHVNHGGREFGWRVGPLMASNPSPIERSEDEESNGGGSWPFRSTKARVLDLSRLGFATARGQSP